MPDTKALHWDASGEKVYENGVSKGVLYLKNSDTPAKWVGYAWSGLTAVT